MEARSHARTRSRLLVGALVAVMVLGACSESNGTTSPAAGPGVHEATLPPPPVSMPPGVSALCTSATRSVVAKIVGPLHGAVPADQYTGTLFSVLLNASLNDCTSHKEWLDAASSAVPRSRELLDVVFDNACTAAKGITTSGGSGPLKPIPLPQSCRTTPSPTTPAATTPATSTTAG